MNELLTREERRTAGQRLAEIVREVFNAMLTDWDHYRAERDAGEKEADHVV